MKLSDLVELFDKGFDAALEAGDILGATRAGVRTVVEALRDEMWRNEEATFRFNEILGSSEVKVAGVCPDGNEVMLTGLLRPEAPTAAPVCEWTLYGQRWHLSCGNGTHFDNETARRGRTHCPSCGLPIKFRKAKP